MAPLDFLDVFRGLHPYGAPFDAGVEYVGTSLPDSTASA